MSKASDKVNSQELYRAILSLQSEEECRRFFKDLCTISELRAMEQRYDVAVLLDQGMVYSDILEATGASSATISRVNRALNYGENGYKDILSRMKEQK
jgi:TrpR-related protein YerC/YecD